MALPSCPCGLGDDYASCCGRYHDGEAAPTAELLMRSRYCAFAVGDAAYLRRTWHPSTRPKRLALDPAQQWTRLVILSAQGGGLLDATGTVEFRAAYLHEGRPGTVAETSQFVREGGRWVYVAPAS